VSEYDYEPLPQDHYLRQVAKELSGFNALALNDVKALDHLRWVVTGLYEWVHGHKLEAERAIPEADDDHGHD